MSQESFKADGPLSTVVVSATTTASATQLPPTSGCQVRIVNEGTGPIRFGFGLANTAPSTVSSTAGQSLLQTSSEVFTIDQQLIGQPAYIYIAASTGTATVNVTRGSGS